MILAIGNSSHYETESINCVRDYLAEKGEDLVIFCQDKCLEEHYLTFQTNIDGSNYWLSIDGRDYRLDDFSAIWYVKPRLPDELLRHENLEYRQFASRQFYTMRSALWSLFSDKIWLNDPWAIRKAENKIFQLSVAQEVGFTVPDTLITSDPNQVLRFHQDQEGDLIVKTLAVSPITDHVLYTNKMSEKDLEAIDSVKLSPSIFQEYLEKDYELRITVVGDKIFAAKILSQDDEATAIDWRREPKLNEYSVSMQETELPNRVKDKIHTLMGKLGLRFGCIDMVVKPNGDYAFLEINSNGQWYFVQLNTGAKIAKAIANLLVK